MRRFCLTVFTLLLTSGCLAQTTNVADRELTKDSSVDEILDALDVRGKDFKTFTADVKRAETTTDFGATTTRSGKVWYQDQGNGKARIRVSFDTKQDGDAKPANEKLDYELIDGKLIERTYRTHHQRTQPVLRPGEKINLLKLGEGPFPLPIGQPKEEVHKQFDVKKIEPAKTDPAGTVHVQLVPKSGTRFARNFKTLDAWVDAKSHMPTRIGTRDRNETSDTTTDLTNLKINPAVNDSDFELEKIDLSKWNVIEEPFRD